MFRMNEANKIDTINPDYTNQSLSRRTSNSTINRADYSTKSAELLNPLAFPCSVEDVYSLGISLQYFMGDIYLNLAASSKGQKTIFKNMAMAQLDVKNELQKQVNADLNEKLAYFYNNGGGIIEPPVSEHQAKELNGFFNRIVANYLNQIDVIVTLTAEGSITPSELETEMNNIIIHMYTSLAKLYKADEIKCAFEAMARCKAHVSTD